MDPPHVFEWIAPGDRAPTRTTSWPAVIESIGEADGHATVRVAADASVPAELRVMAWQFAAYGHDGRARLPSGVIPVADGRTFAFPMRLAEIERVVYEYRPYEWRSLGTIRFTPTTRLTPTTRPGL